MVLLLLLLQLLRVVERRRLILGSWDPRSLLEFLMCGRILLVVLFGSTRLVLVCIGWGTVVLHKE